MTLSDGTPSIKPVSITLLGCGKMGSAMLRMWQDRGALSHVHVIKPSPLPEPFATAQNISYSPAFDESMVMNSDIFMIAVKPQMLERAIFSVAKHIPERCCILSILAGKELSTLLDFFNNKQPIVRIMPNTPSSIGKGVSAAVANESVTLDQRRKVELLLGVLGSLYWVKDENLMNAIAALSGSGPAYVFYLIEVLSKAGRNIGIPANLAEALARQTVIGSAALAEKDGHIPASTLREDVTSPGGSTAEALRILMDGKLESIFCDALKAAKNRGEELNN